MIRYSIVIPTYNNSEILNICLEYITKLNPPKLGYEVLVIDNGSTDKTKEIIKSYENKISSLKYIFDETPGLLTGRHVGALKSKGEILCYLDDDSFVDKNWLVEIEKTFSKPDVVLVGGNNLPLFEVRAPRWLKYFWSDFKYGKCLCELSLISFFPKVMSVPAWFVFGCNFIIKKEILFKFGGFNPDCMPENLQKFQGDGETALSCKLNQSGHTAQINPRIRIFHFVSKKRMTIDYFRKRAFYQGICDSFSKLRKEKGYKYYDFSSPFNIESIKVPFLLRKYKKVFKPIINKILYKLDPAYIKFLEIRKEYEIWYNRGFDFHQNEVKNDPELLRWVLKENYFD